MNVKDSGLVLDVDTARRLRLALTASGAELFTLLQDPAGEVLRTLLKNPRLGEDHLLVLLKRRDLTEDLLKAVSQLKLGEGSHRVKLALAKNPGTPGTLLQSLLPQLYLFELIELCFLPGVTPDQKVAAERVVLQRLPTTALGNKMTMARRGTATIVDALLKEGDIRLMDPCLQNPRLREVSILQFLNGPHASAETISAIARNPRWKQRPNLKMAMLKNRKTPVVWFTVYLPRLKTQDLHALISSRKLAPGQKQLVEEELRKRGF
ncbi:hypothetical protein [Trichloromonas sp.]|uniref:hypothetical protein n=1 Tax=Trichloromonas sp. TaxID=3069249 RepID=UPI003D814222